MELLVFNSIDKQLHDITILKTIDLHNCRERQVEVKFKIDDYVGEGKEKKEIQHEERLA